MTLPARPSWPVSPAFREVQWDSFRPNFFMVFSPGTLTDSTGTYITSVHIPREQRPVLMDFVRKFPEVTAIDLEAILTQVRGVMDKASLAVQYVFGFTLLAGVTVLLAAIQATRDERRYESAMLRTLGASRRVVLQGVAAEFTTLGILSGTLAAIGATAAGYFLATQDLQSRLHVRHDRVGGGIGGRGGAGRAQRNIGDALRRQSSAGGHAARRLITADRASSSRPPRSGRASCNLRPSPGNRPDRTPEEFRLKRTSLLESRMMRLICITRTPSVLSMVI